MNIQHYLQPFSTMHDMHFFGWGEMGGRQTSQSGWWQTIPSSCWRGLGAMSFALGFRWKNEVVPRNLGQRCLVRCHGSCSVTDEGAWSGRGIHEIERMGEISPAPSYKEKKQLVGWYILEMLQGEWWYDIETKYIYIYIDGIYTYIYIVSIYIQAIDIVLAIVATQRFCSPLWTCSTLKVGKMMKFDSNKTWVA